MNFWQNDPPTPIIRGYTMAWTYEYGGDIPYKKGEGWTKIGLTLPYNKIKISKDILDNAYAI